MRPYVLLCQQQQLTSFIYHSRFEEVDEKPAREATKDSKKRPRESDAMDTDEPKLSKSQQKKVNKKQKAEDGKAVATGEAKEEKKEKNDKKKEKAEKSEKASSKVVELAGGLKIQDAKAGTGRQAKKGDKVFVRYIGKLTNGKEFDKNVSGKPVSGIDIIRHSLGSTWDFKFDFRLGKGEVIKGWDEGIVGMKVGGERLLTIPPALAYGKKGNEAIPPNATLVFGWYSALFDSMWILTCTLQRSNSSKSASLLD